MGKHYVPQEYLRGFASSDERVAVWMFDKLRGCWSDAAIKQVAQERDYYPADVEARLRDDVEGPGHRALNALRAGQQLSAEQRGHLAYYIAVLVMRGPRKRRKATDLVPRAVESAVGNARSALEELRTDANHERIERLLQQVQQIEVKYEATAASTLQEQIESPWPSAQIVSAVAGMTWRLTTVPKDRFLITSDSPAFYFDSYGLGSDRAELTFPIDRRVALLGSYQGEAGTAASFIGKAELAKEVNRRVASGAERFIFSPKRESWIETVALKPRPYLSRIDW